MAVWEIASRRHDTKRGKNHLSDHAYEVLQHLVFVEQSAIMANVVGEIQGIRKKKSLLD